MLILDLSQRSGNTPVVLGVVILGTLLQGIDFAQTCPPPNPIVKCTLSNGTVSGFFGGATVSGWYTTGATPSTSNTSSITLSGNSNYTESYTFTGPLDGPGYLQVSNIPPPPCILGCPPGGNPRGSAVFRLFYSNNYSANLSFEDSGELFSGSTNLSCTTTTPPPPPSAVVTVTNIMFDYRGSDLNPTDGLSIRKNRNTKYLHELNGKQGTGEWNKGGSRNEPVLYIANQQNVTIMVRFQASDPCVTTADMSAIAQSQPPLLPNVKKTTVNFVNGISGNGGPDTDAGSYVTMTLDRATDNMLNKVAETWRWMTENVNGYGAAAVQTDMSGPHTVYTVLAAPGLPWYAKDNGMVKEGTVAWTDALDFVMDAVNAKGKASPADATSAITQWLFSSFLLRYDTVNKGTPAYTEGKTGSPIFDLARFITLPHYAIVNCDDMAAAVSTLSNLVGAYAQFNFMKPFGYINTTALIGVGQNNSPYFENIIFKTTPLTPIVQPPGSCREDSFIDNAPLPPSPWKRSFFSNHAFVILNEKVFDATAGPALGTDDLQGYFKKVIDTSPDIRSPTFVHVMDPQRGVLLVRVCTIETGTKANVTPGTVTLDTP